MVANKNIRVSEEIKKRLNELRQHKRETYDDILIRKLKKQNETSKKSS